MKSLKKSIFKFVILLQIFIYPINLNSNNNVNSDSIRIENQIKLIDNNIELIKNNQEFENDSFLTLAQQTLYLSKKYNYNEGILNGYYYLGKIYYKKHNIDSAEFYFEKGIKESLDNYDFMVQFLWEYAFNKWQIGNYAAALENSLKIKTIVESGNTTLYNYRIYNLLGLCYNSLQEFDLAIENYNKSLNLAIAENDEQVTGLILSNLGDLYYYQQQYTEALDYLKRGVKLEEKHGLNFNASFSHNAIANIYLKLNLLDSVTNHIEKAYNLSIQSGNKVAFANTYLSYGNYYYERNELDKSKDYTYKLIEIANTSSSKKLLTDAYWLLSKINSEQKDYKSAFESFDKYFALYSELYNIKDINKVKALEQILILKDKENELFELELKKQKTTNNLLIIIFGLALIVSILFIVLYFQSIKSKKGLRKINQELKKSKIKAEESDQLKSHFLRTISHEIRTPLNGIIGFSALITKKNFSNNNLENIYQLIHKSSTDLISIIENIVDMAHITTHQYQIYKSKFNVLTFTEDLINVAKKNPIFIDKEDLEIKLEKTFEIDIFTDRNILQKIVTQLLKNAVLFTDKGVITVGFEQQNSKLHFFVKDTGIGIPQEKIKLIFSAFRKGAESSTDTTRGSGLGLSIVINFIELLNGKIWVDSSLQKGSTFTFEIPLN